MIGFLSTILNIVISGTHRNARSWSIMVSFGEQRVEREIFDSLERDDGFSKQIDCLAREREKKRERERESSRNRWKSVILHEGR